MPVLEVSEETYSKILKDLEVKRKGEGKGSRFRKAAGTWKNLDAEDFKNKTFKAREGFQGECRFIIPHLIDTDWAVDYLTGVDEKVSFLRSAQDLHIASISVGELVEGIEGSKNRSKRKKGLENFLTDVTVVPFTKEIAYVFGRNP